MSACALGACKSKSTLGTLGADRQIGSTTQAVVSVLTTDTPLASLLGNLQAPQCCYAAQGKAVIGYCFRVTAKSHTSGPVDAVPVNVHTSGEAHLTSAGPTDFAVASARVDNLSFEARANSSRPSAGFNEVARVETSPDVSYAVTMTVEAALANDVNAEFQVVVDPWFEIDPTFPFGDDFEVQVSTGVSNTPPLSCVGDCDRGGDVTVNELITRVNVALGNVTIRACMAGDANGDGEITVNEIIIAVNNALDGC